MTYSMTHSMKSPMTHAIKLLTALLLLGALLAPAVSAQELIAEVDRQNIGLNDTLVLTVRQNGRNFSASPDFEALRRDFDILGNQRSHQTQIVNGDMQAWTEWRLTLSPKRAGTLDIPAFELDGNLSEPLEVNVKENRDQPDSEGRNIFVDTELNKEQVHVQEQLLFTVRLYSSVNLDGAEIQPLEIDNTVVKVVGEQNYISTIDGRQHIVLETTYALFPQRSGTLEIPALVYDLAVSRGQRDFWGRSSRQRLRTEPHSVEVEAIAPDFQGNTWLPARDIHLSQHWSADPEKLRQGEPVTRRITLEADGLTAAQLPTLELGEADGVTLYPDRPQTDEQVSASGVRSTSTLTVALVPNADGRITLPPVTLHWWDTEANEPRTAELPATRLSVSAVPGAAPPPSTTPTARDESTLDNPANVPASAPTTPMITWLLALASAILLGITLWFAFVVWRLKRTLSERERQAQREQDRGRVARSRAWQAVKRAAGHGDLPALRRALLDWGTAVWPEIPPRGLTDLADRLEDDLARTKLRELDALLFNGSDHSDFDAQALVQALNQSRAGHRRPRGNEAGLKPLYRASK
ncbi:BatD family protein [Marinimicrobium sp. ARAG 43.8]|uniref:BatD family protein n=1 Tax=Marinimicrobium sp. ARAG 43.8 TaxID=3418719 RepID=UPI003CE92CCD